MSMRKDRTQKKIAASHSKIAANACASPSMLLKKNLLPYMKRERQEEVIVLVVLDRKTTIGTKNKCRNGIIRSVASRLRGFIASQGSLVSASSKLQTKQGPALFKLPLR